MDNQMIGRRGEKRFDVLCSDAGVTCNRSIEDDYGWDKLIEFPARIVPLRAIDQQPGHLVASVQVKTTATASRSVSISLSNALRYAKSSIPQFVVLVTLDEGEPRFFARHVWGALITDCLKAGRQADADGVSAIHQRTVNISFGADDERGDGLLNWIRAEIEAVREPYAATKKLFVDTVGFEKGYGTAKVTFSLESAEDLVDLQLGLLPHLEAKRFTYTSERFGIRAGKPEVDEENVRIYLTPEGRPCSLRLEFAAGGSVTVPATLYGAEAGGSTAMRVASRALDATFGPGDRVRAHAHVQRDDRARLDELCAFAHLLASKPRESISMHLDVNGDAFDLGSITMNGPIREEAWSWIALGMNTMRAIAADSGQTARDITIGEIDDAAGELQILSALASDRIIRVDFTPEPDVPVKFDGFLAYSNAVIGEQVFSAVAYRPIGFDKMEGHRRRVAFGPGKLLWGRIVSKDAWSEDVVRAAYQRQLDRLSDGAQIMAVGNLERMTRGPRGDRELKSDLPTGRDHPILSPRRKGSPGKSPRSRK